MLNIQGLTLMEILSGLEIPVYIFPDFKKEKNNTIEKQLIKSLTAQGFASCHIPRREHVIWTDICRILFCQAFLVRHETYWEIETWEIKNQDKANKCWDRLKTADILEYFKHQWKFLERLQFGYMDDQRREKIKKDYFQRRLWIQFRRGYYDEMTFVNSNILLANNAGVLKQTHIVPKKDVFANDYLLFTNIDWQPAKYQKFYLELLKCIDRDSILNLMKDILDDFKKSAYFYEVNSDVPELNPWRWGMPDIVAYNKGNSNYILLECKGPTDRFKKQQIRWFKRNADLYKLNVAIVVASENQIAKIKADFSCCTA